MTLPEKLKELEELQRDLAQHALGLRSMARDLVRDPHIADDMVQETMRSALTHSVEPGPMGGWLRRTMHNFTRQWRRTERRRVAREEKLDRPTTAPATDEVSSRREILRTVSEAVLALDEPYQTTIFLRYFEDLPPRAIAKRTGANLATIKSRLQRGLAMLRARLDQKSGGDRRQWRLALLGTFGLPVTTAAAGITLTYGTLIMGTAAKTLIAAGLLGAVGLYFYGFGQDPKPIEAVTASNDEKVTAATAGSNLAQPEQPTVREAAAPEADVPSWLDHPYALELDVLVVDFLGLPVKSRTLHLAPIGCSLNKAMAKTGEDGRVKVTWRSRQPSGEILLAGERGSYRRVRLQHGRPTALTLIADHSRTLRATGTDGKLAALMLRLTDLEAGAYELTNPTRMPKMREGMHPHAVFATWPGASSKPDHAFQVTLSAASSPDGSFMMTYLRPKKPSEQDLAITRVTGTVFGEDGKPAEKVHVALLRGGIPVFHDRTDADGRFAFEKLAAEEFTIRAGGDAEGLAMCPAVTTQGTTPVTLHLKRGSIVSGKAQGSDGKPLAKATVVWRADDGSWIDSTKTTADGTFTFANLPGKSGTVLLWHLDKSRRLPIAFEKGVLPNSGDLLLADDASGGAIRVTPQEHEDVSGYAAVRVWSEDMGIATDVPRPEKGAELRLGGLMSGWYRVELFHPATGIKDAGRHWVDGKGDCHLGHVTLPKPAKARVVFAGKTDKSKRSVELYRVDRNLDVRIEIADNIASVDPLENLLLEAGDYVLFWLDKAEKIHFQRFTTEAGKEVTVRVPL